MKKIIFKSTKAVIAAAAICAVLALGTLCSSSGNYAEPEIITVAAWPGFCEGGY